MSERDMYEKGREIGRRIWGETRFDRMEASAQELNPRFRDLALWTWGLYSNPVVDMKTRSLCMVASLTVLGQQEELRMHVFGALNNGASHEEIEEVIMQMAPYGGLPKSRGALLVAKKCFSEYEPGAK
jgi:4-carboxymuconolactone decarboxylase